MYWKGNVLIPPKIDPTDHWKKRGKNGKVKMKFQKWSWIFRTGLMPVGVFQTSNQHTILESPMLM